MSVIQKRKKVQVCETNHQEFSHGVSVNATARKCIPRADNSLGPVSVPTIYGRVTTHYQHITDDLTFVQGVPTVMPTKDMTCKLMAVQKNFKPAEDEPNLMGKDLKEPIFPAHQTSQKLKVTTSIAHLEQNNTVYSALFHDKGRKHDELTTPIRKKRHEHMSINFTSPNHKQVKKCNKHISPDQDQKCNKITSPAQKQGQKSNKLTSPDQECSSLLSPCLKKRIAANARERRRMHGLNEAFERLRRAMPDLHGSCAKLSKYDTLQLANNYIQELQQLLQQHASTQQ